MELSSALHFLLLLVPAVLADRMADCRRGLLPECKDYSIGLNSVRPSGTRVHGHANIPVHEGQSGKVQANVHGSHVYGGPHNGAQTVGGGLNYQHNNGLYGDVDATHVRGQGNSYSANVGGSTKVGPGTLSVGGGAQTVPGSSKVQGQVGATYTIPLNR